MLYSYHMTVGYFYRCLQTELTIQYKTQPFLLSHIKHVIYTSPNITQHQLTSVNLTQPHHTSPNLPQHLLTSPYISHPCISSPYWNHARSLLELSCKEITSILIPHPHLDNFINFNCRSRVCAHNYKTPIGHKSKKAHTCLQKILKNHPHT